MTNSSTTTGFRPNMRLLAAGALMGGVGSMIATVGIGMVGLSLALAGRQWARSWETPPTERAHRTIHQARTASQAGLEAWRSYSPSVN